MNGLLAFQLFVSLSSGNIVDSNLPKNRQKECFLAPILNLETGGTRLVYPELVRSQGHRKVLKFGMAKLQIHRT